MAMKRIKEAFQIGVKIINLSGGETMCYPHVHSIIRYGRDFGIEMNIATSGYRLDEVELKKLTDADVSHIFISLNGSTKEINDRSRDGFDLAIDALKLLDSANYKNTCMNWVMHSHNADDFLNVLEIAEQYHVKKMVVLSFKPDANGKLSSYPSGEQIKTIANQIRLYRGKTEIAVETCFSPLLAVIKDTRLFGNLNKGLFIGCGAGRFSYNVNIDGLFSPCRHIECFEKFEHTEEYWHKSQILEKLRNVEKDTRSPCAECRYCPYCRHCMAINSVIHAEIYKGFEDCTLWKE